MKLYIMVTNDVYELPLAVADSINELAKLAANEYRCRYCRRKTAKYQNVCAECYRKLLLVRRIVAIGDIIRKEAGRQQDGEH